MEVQRIDRRISGHPDLLRILPLLQQIRLAELRRREVVLTDDGNRLTVELLRIRQEDIAGS